MRVEKVILGDLATNCYLLETDGTTVLIDPAVYDDRLGEFLAGRNVDLVINTHGHFDHVGGDWALKKAGAKLLIHRADLRYVDEFYPGHPGFDRYIDDGDEIAGLRVIHTPGHSPGSIVLIGDGIMFSGDLLFAGSIGRTDFPGGSMSEMRRSLRRILSLGRDFVVYPGHGPRTRLSVEQRKNPFLQGRMVDG